MTLSSGQRLIRWIALSTFIKPFKPKSDKYQFSPNIDTSSKEMVMRIRKMITKGKNALISDQIILS